MGIPGDHNLTSKHVGIRRLFPNRRRTDHCNGQISIRSVHHKPRTTGGHRPRVLKDGMSTVRLLGYAQTRLGVVNMHNLTGNNLKHNLYQSKHGYFM